MPSLHPPGGTPVRGGGGGGGPVPLELGEIDIELLGGGIDVPVLIHGLHPLGGEAELDVAPQLVREVPLGLEVDVLDLLVAGVREGDDAGLAVRALPEQVAHAGAHLHAGAGRSSDVLKIDRGGGERGKEGGKTGIGVSSGAAAWAGQCSLLGRSVSRTARSPPPPWRRRVPWGSGNQKSGRGKIRGS